MWIPKDQIQSEYKISYANTRKLCQGQETAIIEALNQVHQELSGIIPSACKFILIQVLCNLCPFRLNIAFTTL